MAKEPVPIKFPPTPEIADAFARALAIASKLPEVEESRSYGTPAIRVKGKLIARRLPQKTGKQASTNLSHPERRGSPSRRASDCPRPHVR